MKLLQLLLSLNLKEETVRGKAGRNKNPRL
jgi:hypothetical protein